MWVQLRMQRTDRRSRIEIHRSKKWIVLAQNI
jgi:hypothetical protein